MFFRFALLIAASFYLVATPAGAASFDCTNAGTTFEKAICADPTLSELDETLLVAYKTALGGLSEDAAAVVRQGHRDWLDFAERACTETAEPAAEAYDTEGTQCLAGLYRDRIGSLEKSRMMGGYRFYPRDSYAVLPDTTGDSWVKVAAKTISVVRIDGDSAIADVFNAAMDGEFALARAGWSVESGGELDVTTDTAYEVKPHQVNARVITAKADSYFYGHGAAHGNYHISYLHFLVNEGRKLEARDVFAGEGWKAALAELALEKLREAFDPESLFVKAPGEIVETVADPEHWQFGEDGLKVQFTLYEVAPYAAGMPVIGIAWEDLQPYLAENASGIIYGY